MSATLTAQQLKELNLFSRRAELLAALSLSSEETTTRVRLRTVRSHADSLSLNSTTLSSPESYDDEPVSSSATTKSDS